MSTVSIKRHDVARSITDTLLLGDAPIDLTGSTVSIIFRSGLDDPIKRTATIVDAVAGTVSYQFVAADTAVAGTFNFEWEIVFPGGSHLTVPSDGYHTLVIRADLG